MDTVDLLAAVLSGDAAAATSLAALDAGVVRHTALHHGVLSLAAERLAGRPDLAGAAVERLRDEAARQAAADVVREAELVRMLGDFNAAGLHPLVFKGAQLAYSEYARPDLRARVDTDLFIALSEREAAHARLTALGYDAPPQVTGDLVLRQASYAKHQGTGRTHLVDLHWKIANPYVFSDALTFDEAQAHATALPRLSPFARGLARHHALLVACVHRVAHHYDSDRLIWLYDIHLLASGMSTEAWGAFAAHAADRRVKRICRLGLEQASRRFGTAIPRAVVDRLADADGDEPEPTAEFLARDRRPVENFLADMRAVPGLGGRLRLVREHLFPSPAYMRRVYAPASRAPLPLLYAHRVLRGARRWFART